MFSYQVIWCDNSDEIATRLHQDGDVGERNDSSWEPENSPMSVEEISMKKKCHQSCRINQFDPKTRLKIISCHRHRININFLFFWN